jgi:adenylate kinase family enzyme
MVLLICGGKGVGKTTVAQLVCKNEIMKSHFSMVIWVCYRENPSPELAILRSLCKKLEFAGCIDSKEKNSRL